MPITPSSTEMSFDADTRRVIRLPLRKEGVQQRAAYLPARIPGEFKSMRSTRTVTGPGRSKIETSPVTLPSMIIPGWGTRPSR
jgi:hypothetical protein